MGQTGIVTENGFAVSESKCFVFYSSFVVFLLSIHGKSDIMLLPLGLLEGFKIAFVKNFVKNS